MLGSLRNASAFERSWNSMISIGCGLQSAAAGSYKVYWEAVSADTDKCKLV